MIFLSLIDTLRDLDNSDWARNGVEKMAEVAAYFRGVREKYAEFEGSLKGVDARILTAQVPGGMLTNMEGQCFSITFKYSR